MMPTCDLCGKPGQLFKAVVEGSMLSVCQRCSTHGNVIAIERPPQEELPRQKQERAKPEEPVELITPDYAKLIKKAREARNLTQEKLGLAIAEKESVIHKLEAGQMEPPLKLAKKLEQFLHITLICKELKETPKKPVTFKDSALTIGDLLDLKHEE